MRLAQTRVCAELICVSVRGSFIEECGSEKKLLTEQKNRTSIDSRTPTVVTLHRFSLFTPPKTNFIMPILVRKAKMRLTYREEKPEVHVVRRLTYPKVTGKQLVQYAANVASVSWDQTWNMQPVCLRRLANALDVAASARGHHDSSVL